jgi:hypothetical protein
MSDPTQCPQCADDCAECSSPGVWEDMHAELVELRAENAKLREQVNSLEWAATPEYQRGGA